MEDKEFDRLLKITRLRVSDGERSMIKKDVEQVIAYFDEVSAVDAGKEQERYPAAIPGRFREDVVSSFADVDGLKRNSKMRNGYIVGPKL